MKVLAVNGSPRRGGNTQTMIDEAVKVLRKARIDVECVFLADYSTKPCNACDACSKRTWHCPIKDDAVKLLKKMADCDGVLIGSPVYGAAVTAQLKALFDRGIIPYNDQLLRNKVGGAIIVGGGAHGGQELAALEVMAFFAFQGMIVANPTGQLFGAMATANEMGDAKKDKEGLASARDLAKRMVELMTILRI